VRALCLVMARWSVQFPPGHADNVRMMDPTRTGDQGGTPDLGDGVTDETTTTVMTTVPRNGAADRVAPDIDNAIVLGRQLVSNLSQVLLGTPGALTAAAIAALSGGHLLIEDVPGVGKTVLARALALSLGADLSRVQGHPDLLPSDITGVSVFSPDTGTWEFRPGPVFAHVLLVDELNRTPPRTQAALLETMEEQQVSVDGESYPLPHPHLVIATQNPLSQLGTYPLVESQLDRFALATAIGYPDADTETRLVLHHGGKFALSALGPVCTTTGWLDAQRATETVTVVPAIAEYAVALCRASRTASGVRLGASPRAAIWLIRSAQAHAVLSARVYVTPDDVKAVATACLAHRLMTDEGVERGVAVVRELLESTPAPRP
jgi:MoxR-like ATPase